PVSDAGAGGAAPGGRLEDGAVGRADQRAAVLGEELVRPEIERRADVRATVDIRAVAAIVVHDEAVHGAPGALDTEGRALTGRHRRGDAAPLVRARHGPDGIISGMLAIDARDVEKTFRSGWPRRRETRALRGVSLAV